MTPNPCPQATAGYQHEQNEGFRSPGQSQAATMPLKQRPNIVIANNRTFESGQSIHVTVERCADCHGNRSKRRNHTVYPSEQS